MGGPGDRRVQLWRQPVRDRGPLLARQRAARRGRVRRGGLHRRVPQARVAVRHQERPAEDFARIRSGGHLSGDHRGRDDQAGGGVVALTENETLREINADYEKRFGFHDPENYLYKAPKGLTRELVEKISEFKSEPQWMRDFRLKALDHFLARPMPTWGSPFLAEVDFDNIHYFVRASEKASRSWDEVPEDVKNTFDRLGIPEAERKFLAGVGAQYESEVVYHQVREDLEKQGVEFLDMDSGLREHEDLVREYFATVIPANDNKLASLNSAVWSGGSCVYAPPRVHAASPHREYL